MQQSPPRLPNARFVEDAFLYLIRFYHRSYGTTVNWQLADDDTELKTIDLKIEENQRGTTGWKLGPDVRYSWWGAVMLILQPCRPEVARGFRPRKLDQTPSAVHARFDAYPHQKRIARTKNA